MGLAALVSFLIVMGFIVIAGYLVFLGERRKVQRRRLYAEQNGASFVLTSKSLGSIPLVDIPLLLANSNSKAICLMSKKTASFESHHFNLNISSPPGAPVRRGAITTAAVYRLSEIRVPRFSLASKSGFASLMSRALSDEGTEVESGDEVVIRYSKDSIKSAYVKQLLSLKAPRTTFPNGFFLQGDGEWIFVRSSHKVPVETWYEATNGLVEKLLSKLV